MSIADILKQRLYNQWLVASPAKSPAEVVGQLLAVQAQDYLGSLWGIGQRLDGSTESSVEQAVANGSIIRTWPMRGTLHFVAAEDARWLCDFLAARVLPKTRSVYKNAGLDAAVFKKSERLIVKALEKNPRLTRDELYQRLEKAGIDTKNSRGLHITGYLAVTGLICLGPRNGKQHTFVLRDEWLGPVKHVRPDDIPATLAVRYFKSHGPATVHDFAWWTGLTLTEARNAISSAGSALNEINVKDTVFYQTQHPVSTENTKANGKVNVAQLLPAFDEFTVAYKDRTLLLPAGQQHRKSMEILSPTISFNGMVTGTWSRSIGKNSVAIETKPFAKLPAVQLSKVKLQAKKYAKFVGLTSATIE